MSEVVVKVQGLGKLYRIGTRHNFPTLRDAITECLASPFKKIKGFLQRDRIDNRKKSENSIWALKDVSFAVRRGEVLGIIGPNGAGKSTLLKILSRITEPTEGYAEIMGRMGSLLEVGTGFHPELTGRENIYLNGALLGMKKKEIDRRFDEILAFAEIEKFLDTPVKHYSSGMYVRLAFAVAAHLEPEVLLVDEVLAVGDVAFQKKCLGKMEGIAKEGRTVIVVSHNMATIASLCDKCILLKRGEISKEGEPSEVIQYYLANDSGLGKISLAERLDRKGSGAITFVDVCVYDSRGRPRSSVLSGEDIYITVKYISRELKGVNNLDIHITFYTLMGQFLFNCSSEGSGLVISDAPSQGTLVCNIPKLPLCPGTYIYNLYATTGGTIADWVIGAGTLNVIENDYFGSGLLKTHKNGFLVDHNWIMKK